MLDSGRLLRLDSLLGAARGGVAAVVRAVSGSVGAAFTAAGGWLGGASGSVRGKLFGARGAVRAKLSGARGAVRAQLSGARAAYAAQRTPASPAAAPDTAAESLAPASVLLKSRNCGATLLSGRQRQAQVEDLDPVQAAPHRAAADVTGVHPLHTQSLLKLTVWAATMSGFVFMYPLLSLVLLRETEHCGRRLRSE